MVIDEIERIANALCGDNIYNIDGVAGYEYPTELNAFILVMSSGRKFKVEVTEYAEEER